jgi:hypothetical protein
MNNATLVSPHSAFNRAFCVKMNQKPDKTEENPKKPVETEEIRLTNLSEKPKVNCGTVLRTRMNIGEHAFGNGCFLLQFPRGQGERAQRFSILNARRRSNTWQRE